MSYFKTSIKASDTSVKYTVEVNSEKFLDMKRDYANGVVIK